MTVISGRARGLLIRTDPDYAEKKKRRASDVEALEGVRPFDGPSIEGWLPIATRRAASLHPWDEAHAAFVEPARAGLEATAPIEFVEPDFEQSLPFQAPEPSPLESVD